MSCNASRKLLLVILDGFGHRQGALDNAITLARTPNWDGYLATCPHTLLSGSGLDVGLPAGQMGNSEVGHMVIGAGRVIHQDFVRVNQAIAQGEFAHNPRLNALFERVKNTGGALHVLGLLSPGGVHAHEDQVLELIALAHRRGLARVCLHAFLDGRDTPPRSASPSLARAQALLQGLGVGRIVSICGRYFAMDRDQRWDRTERAYNLITRGEASFHAEDAASALEMAYARGETDEFVQPTAVHGRGMPAPVLSGRDAVVFMNFRADRARQLTRALLQQPFQGFARHSFNPPADLVTLTRYADDIDAGCILEPVALKNTLGECLSALGKRQLRAAETEKYAHVTFFLSGGREAPFAGEERLLVPSPRVPTYDQKPEMSAAALTDGLVEAMGVGRFDAIVCNYANGDMVGHTGDLDAAVAAVEVLDHCLGRLAKAGRGGGWHILITADHGNVEQMSDPKTGQAHHAHTTHPVPLVYIGPERLSLRDGGTLADVAPTMLRLMGIAPPPEMTGRSLVHQTDVCLEPALAAAQPGRG